MASDSAPGTTSQGNSAMDRVFLVECRTYLNEPTETGLEIESAVAFVGSTLAKAEAFIRMNPDFTDAGDAWCWSVWDAALDVFDRSAEDIHYYTRDGRPCLSQMDAFGFREWPRRDDGDEEPDDVE